MQSDGLVSIVVVAYNNWPDLELAIQSALHQSYGQIEVIVVDNSSSDETAEIVPKMFGSQIRYLRQANTGEGGGRNGGFQIANGEFIQFLDGDDFLAPDKIEKQIATFRASPEADIAYGDARQFQSAAGLADWEDWDGQEFKDVLATLLSPDGNGCGFVTHSLIFRRRALELVGPWLENSPAPSGSTTTNMADQDYWLRAAWAGCRFQYCPGSLCFQRKRPGQLGSNPRNVLRGMVIVFTRAREYIIREPYKFALSQRLGHLLFYLAVSEKKASLQKSMARLVKAREVCPHYVSPAAFAIGYLLIVSRAGPFVFGRWLRPIRRLAASFAGMRKVRQI